MSTIECPQCRRSVPAGSAQCPYCSAPLQAPPAAPGAPTAPVQPVEPHRGGMILAFGILGIVCCLAFGIAAWIMGNRDLAEMEAGRMDLAGQGMTLAGKICGIIGIVLQILSLIYTLLMFLLGLGGAFGSMGAA